MESVAAMATVTGSCTSLLAMVTGSSKQASSVQSLGSCRAWQLRGAAGVRVARICRGLDHVLKWLDFADIPLLV